MYISDKIVNHGEIIDSTEVLGQFVIIRAEDYPNEPGMRRTAWSSQVEVVMEDSRNNLFLHTKSPHDGFVGVEIERLREFRPSWCITKNEVLQQFEAMQREDRSGPLKLDLRKDPELLTIAKRLWSERLAEKKT